MKNYSAFILIPEFSKNLLIRLTTFILSITGFIRKTHKDRFKETHINRAVKKRKAGSYMEIGVRNGACFNQVSCRKKVGVDPAPDQFGDSLKEGEYFFKEESDTFFIKNADEVYKEEKIDVALVDGLHEFTQALRDILNVEKYISEKGIIFVHDCNPPTRQHADVRDGGEWNGDVWKIAVYFRKYRKDLKFFTLDCDWGVGVITGFSGDGKKDKPDPEIIRQLKELDYGYFDKNRQQILHLRPSSYSRFFLKFSH